MDLPGISITEADQRIFLQSRADGARPVVDAAMLRALLQAFGAGDCPVDEAALASAVHDCNSRQDPFVMQLAQRIDATVEVTVAPDDMQAEINIRPAQGGKPASVEGLKQALAAAGVVFGIDDAVLQQVCGANAISAVPVAKGTAPVDGRDATFEELIAQVTDRAPKVGADGMIDYREHGSIEVVAVGMPLMRRHPATPGVDGQNVRGRLLPARPGRDEPFASPLAGAQCARDDPNLLEASVAGQPVRVTAGISVEPVLAVAEVNMATGNIHFDGSVQVQGDVIQGMTVRASGDIVVAGMVDGGILEAGGDIHITGGVIANAKLRAQGSLSAKFAQGVQMHAGTVLSLSDMAMECELESLNQIVIGAQSSGRGRLVGGCATAMMLLSVPLLGSAKGTVTRVVLGANAELSARYAQLLQRLEQEKSNEEALEKLIKQVTAAKDPKGMLPRIQASRQHAIQVWGKSLAEKNVLEQEIARAMAAKLSVGVAVEGAVDLVFGTYSARIRRDFGAGSFSLDPAELVVMFSDGNTSRPAGS